MSAAMCQGIQHSSRFSILGVGNARSAQAMLGQRKQVSYAEFHVAKMLKATRTARRRGTPKWIEQRKTRLWRSLKKIVDWCLCCFLHIKFSLEH